MTTPPLSIGRAVTGGWFTVSVPAVAAVALPVGALAALDAAGVVSLPRDRAGVTLIAAVLLPAALLVMRVIWALGLTRWRLWAYPRVGDVAELKRQARRVGLIPRQGSWLERLEPRTPEQRERLRRLDPDLS